MWRLHRRSILGIVAALVVLLALYLWPRTDPVMVKAIQLQEQVQTLDARLRSLEKQSAGAPADPKLEDLRQFGVHAKELEARIAKSVDAKDIDQAKSGLETLESLPKSLEAAANFARQLPASSGPRAIGAKQVIAELVGVQDLGQELLDKAGSRQKVIAQIDSAVKDIPALKARAERLIPKKAAPHSGAEVPEILAVINASIKAARGIVAGYAPPPVIPFQEQEATLSITTTSDLAENLVLPMLKARSHGESVSAPGQTWFYTSKPGFKPEEKVLVRLAPGGACPDLIAGRADLIVSDIEPTAAEFHQFEEQFPGHSLKSNSDSELVAFDALTLLAHPDSKRLEVSDEEAKKTAWIGGTPGSVEHSTALRMGFQISKTAEEPAAAVLADLSFRGLGIYHKEKDNIRAARLAYRPAANTPAVMPSQLTIATRDYKFSIRIIASNSPRSHAGAVEFVKFMTSPEGQSIVSQRGYVDRSLRSDHAPVDPRILAVLGRTLNMKDIRNAVRLSTNLPFAVANDRLDFEAQGDLERLPSEVARDYPRGKVVVLGFTDSSGTPAHNLELSINRAKGIADRLNLAMKNVVFAGLGQQFPVDTNDTPEGKARNRHAQIWVVLE